jgi:hypothetical protein
VGKVQETEMTDEEVGWHSMDMRDVMVDDTWDMVLQVVGGSIRHDDAEGVEVEVGVAAVECDAYGHFDNKLAVGLRCGDVVSPRSAETERVVVYTDA